MLENLKGLKSYEVFRFFKEMNEIPRGSGDEKQVSDWLVKFAKDRSLEVIQDEALNVIIKKPGTKGYENSPIVVIQGHMDMVCEKNIGTEHDFEKDAIKFIVEGDILRADGTTLGADDGIAVAYGLAALDSNEIAHPPIELLITTEEETGMGGALALDPENIKGKMLINIDSEEEGTLLVSCAGGVRQIIKLPIKKEDADKEASTFKVMIRGLKGGHSGMDINKERGNSNILMARFLVALREEMSVSIESVNGGSKMNAIPREADAILLVKDENKLIKNIEKWNDIFKKELSASDADVTLFAEKVEESIEKVFTEETAEKLISMIMLLPNGAQSMSMNIAGLVESSTNIGIVETCEDVVLFESAVRSSVETLKTAICKRGDAAIKLLGASVEYVSSYPAWQYREDSKLRETMVKVYEEMNGKKPEISAIHAGLECGLFGGKFGADMDMVSFGPNLHDVHTPNEHVEISSVERCWNYLIQVLKALQ
jgi:dipeptidase D